MREEMASGPIKEILGRMRADKEMPKKEVAGREEMASRPRREYSEERKRRREEMASGPIRKSSKEMERRYGERTNKEILGGKGEKEMASGRIRKSSEKGTGFDSQRGKQSD